MPPKVNNNEISQIKPFQHQPPVSKPKAQLAKQKPAIDQTAVATRRWESSVFGTQQKDRLERLFGAGTAGLSTANDVRLGKATANANKAFADTYVREWNALKNPSGITNPPKNMVDVSSRAETAYRTSLKNQGFTPSDVRGTSVVKAADFLRSGAKTSGDFTTLSPKQIQNRLTNNTDAKYFVRVLDSKYLGSRGFSAVKGNKSAHLGCDSGRIKRCEARHL